MAEATAPTLPTEYPGFFYGYQWWIENDSVFSAIGIFGQMIWISTKDELVVVQLSAWEKAEWSEGYAHQAAFITGVTQAVRANVVESPSGRVTEH
jgi:CubicO group peptidase (beta-lactamase class C family)